MRHSQAIRYVEGFKIDELSPLLRQKLEAHLAACPSCSARSVEARALFSMLSAIPCTEPQGFPEALESVRHRTLAAVRAEERHGVPPQRAWAAWTWSRRRLAATAPVLVAAAAILMIVVLRPAAPPPAAIVDASTPPIRPFPETVPEIGEAGREAAHPAVRQAEAEGEEVRQTDAVKGGPAASPRKAPSRPPVEGQKAGSAEFTIVRSGSEVLIEWVENGEREHQIRKGFDPVSVQVAGGLVVSGRTWADTEPHAAPGSVTYYLID